MPIAALPYEAMNQKLWLENVKKVQDELKNNDNELLKKIRKFASKFGFEYSEVRHKIANDEMFVAHFAKNPGKTGFHEKEAAKWLERVLNLEVDTLPKGGANALYVNSDGRIGTIPTNETKPTKSLDLQWSFNNINFYAMHKYTYDEGGSQKSAFNEMEDLLKNFLKASNKSKVLIVIVDGPFYTPARVEQLRNATREKSPKSFAVHIGEVPEIMRQYGWQEINS